MSVWKSPSDAVGRGSRFLSTYGTDPAWAGYICTSGANIAPPAANGGNFMRLIPAFDIVVSALVWVPAVQSGNYDIAILDDAGTRLWSKGSTTIPATGTAVSDTVTGVTLYAGNVYYIGWAGSDGNGALKGIGAAGIGELCKITDGTPSVVSVTSVFPIPSTVTLGSTAPNRLPFVVIRGT